MGGGGFKEVFKCRVEAIGTEKRVTKDKSGNKTVKKEWKGVVLKTRKREKRISGSGAHHPGVKNWTASYFSNSTTRKIKQLLFASHGQNKKSRIFI